MTGEMQGHKVTFSTVSAPTWTVQVKITRLPLAIDITGRHFTTHGASDLRFGDDDFDDQYFVDAAPSEVALVTLNDALRQRIVALKPDRLTLEPGWVKLTKHYRWYFAEADDIAEAIDLAVTLADAAYAATKATEAALLQTGGQAGHPFRGDIDTNAVKSAIAVRDDRINAVVKRQRQRWNKRRAVLIGVGIGYALYLGIVFLFSLLGTRK